jgi:hypothetical protein
MQAFPFRKYITRDRLIYGGVVILVIVIGIMVYSVSSGSANKNIEGFASSSKLAKNNSKRGNRENFLADSIKHFGMTSRSKPSKEKLTNISNNKKSNKTPVGSRSKLGKLAKPGSNDKFKDVMAEVDKIDLEAISLSGFTNTIKKYNDNFNNRLEYARKRNDTNDLESAMAQFDVIKDEFKKLFLFSDYV